MIRPIFAAMNFSWPLLFYTVVIIAFSSCEKEIDIPLGLSNPKVVIEGSIANDQQPLVILTKSIGFFDKIELNSIEFITDADVWVSDLTVNKRIQLFPLVIGDFTIFTIRNSDPEFASFENGIFEHTYKLEVTYNNKLYEAVSKIPGCNGFDSLYFEPAKNISDSVFALKGAFTDPDTIGNYYKYFTKRNGNGISDDDFIEPFSSRFDDQYINGQSIPADLFIGFDDSDTVDNEFQDNKSYSRIGDTIVVKLSAMDAGVYNFWKTLDFAEGSIGNPFASPIQVQTNINTDEAFGVWSAFGNHYDTIINKQ